MGAVESTRPRSNTTETKDTQMSQKSISNTFAILSKMITFYFLVVYIERKQRRWGVGGVILCMVGVLLTFKKPENYIFAVKNKDYSKR